jgi:hypothetical protein
VPGKPRGGTLRVSVSHPASLTLQLTRRARISPGAARLMAATNWVTSTSRRHVCHDITCSAEMGGGGEGRKTEGADGEIQIGSVREVCRQTDRPMGASKPAHRHARTPSSSGHSRSWMPLPHVGTGIFECSKTHLSVGAHPCVCPP